MNYSKFIIFITLSIILISCSEDSNEPTGSKELKMGIITDLHYYSPTLGTESDAFLEYIAGDRKLLAESHSILESVINSIKSASLDIVLISGDLTKDGEKVNHEILAQYLATIEATGKKVYVVPGNHDINNSESKSFPNNSDPTAIPSVTPQEFANIYQEFGFKEAIAKDPNSLSYIAQPKSNVWIFALDACNYSGENEELSETAGYFKESTKNWIITKLQEAKSKNIKCFGFMHHGVVEHFPGMEVVFADYLIRDWSNTAKLFAENGLNFVFTGHHHATDISKISSTNSYLFDIQTGSIVTWICPWRKVIYNYDNNTLDITNIPITEINYNLGGKTFNKYAEDFLTQGMPQLVNSELTKLGLSQEQINMLIPLVTPTLLAYYHGDEPTMVNEQILAGITQLTQSSDPQAKALGMLLIGIYYDETPDNNVMINLNTGSITNK